MRRISDISIDRGPSRSSRVTVTLRSPELAQALSRTGEGLVLILWTVASLILLWLAWQGFLGRNRHLIVIVPVLSAMTLWLAWNGNRCWQERSRTTLDLLTVTLDDRRISISGPDAVFTRERGGEDIRFSARPHRRGKWEEREEKRVRHAVGYAYRDAWEVWCEAGVAVDLIVAVAGEEDARAVVRHLSEENLHVTRDTGQATNDWQRTAPPDGEETWRRHRTSSISWP